MHERLGLVAIGAHLPELLKRRARGATASVRCGSPPAASVNVRTVASRYHAEALRALGATAYVPDPAAWLELEQRAAELGVRFPAALVEWYGMRGGIELLREHSNTDHPIAIADLGANEMRTTSGSAHGRILQLMVENQGVCTWGIPLAAGDDPPVLVAVDPDFA